MRRTKTNRMAMMVVSPTWRRDGAFIFIRERGGFASITGREPVLYICFLCSVRSWVVSFQYVKSPREEFRRTGGSETQRPYRPCLLYSDTPAHTKVTRRSPRSRDVDRDISLQNLEAATALQPAACGLRSPAAGVTGAAASGGVARAASRAARERLTVSLDTAN